LIAFSICLPGIVQAQEGAPLVLAPKNMVSATRAGRLLVLLDLQPQRASLVGMGADQAIARMVATAEHYANELLSSTRYHDVQDAEVVLAFVEDMDQYNRANFAGMVRLGSVKLRRDGDKAHVTEESINRALIK
jgi:hypothetical protein